MELNIQKSFAEKEDGVLYLVPTPIGNLEDMTFRAVRILKEAAVIFAEDTRQTRKLCSHFGISTSLNSYHEHNKEQKGERIISLLKAGQTAALVSDAGTPLVSDPGKEIVRSCIEEGIPVIALPGANAAVTALTASGLGGGPFYFYGFLPRKRKEREDELKKIAHVEASFIFYESPYRVKETVAHLAALWENRQVVLARELTKKFEELIRGSGAEVSDYLQDREIKGECCLIVEGGQAASEQQAWWQGLGMKAHVTRYVEDGLPAKAAIKEAAKDRGVSKREVYAAYHDL
ncbi:16S rRNA (cytidine(1402)-2'-O)-methyltransferase [Bacillus piscicola]|uniref:16S rRNA (cytidine(1402)-2'-O)-methyltransferase n=1 Tax=Bacillus piscicola TaxID=1632684 RepID=UPI001F0936D6|nr:16S rRNA (cytidine(1402)-2'-O)-methyltransferase [Bacillus piscicola]